MHPILLHIGPLTLRTYGAMVALAFLAAYKLSQWAGRYRGLDEKFIGDLVVVILVSGLVGARVLYIALSWPYFAQNLWEIFEVWEGGLVFYGGFLAASVAIVLFARRRKVPVMDVFEVVAPASAFGQAVARWGCFFAGCCYGRPTNLPWGIRFTDIASLAPLGVPLHPTQIYESLGDLVIALILWQMLARTGNPLRSASPARSRQGGRASAEDSSAFTAEQRVGLRGQVFWWYVVLYGALRFTVELFRGDDRGATLGGLYPSQLIALAAVLLGVSILIAQASQREEAHGAVASNHS